MGLSILRLTHFLSILSLLHFYTIRQVQAQPNPEELQKQMEAATYANDLGRSIDATSEYVSVLNGLLAKSQYMEYPNYLDMLAWWFTFNGHVDKGVSLGNRAFPLPAKDTPFDPSIWEVKDAVKVIASEAEHYQVVMLNEEHRMPRHRVLTTMLLQPLYAAGFRYLAVETLSLDSTLQRTGQPVLTTGTYSRDPVFGELLRTASAVGYQITPYEVTEFPRSDVPMTPNELQTFRERAQAQNIISRILIGDPDARILVYGGRGHIAEIYEVTEENGDTLTFGSMAGFFKHLTGIDPLTIDQLQHAEHSDTIYESSVFRWVRRADRSKFGFFNVLVDAKDASFMRRDVYDIAIVPSPTEYNDGRPDWINADGRRSPLSVDVGNFQPTDSTFFLVQAIYANEDHDRAIPADQYAYQASQGSVLLFLIPGDYVLRIVDSEGRTLKQWDQEIQEAQ